jgi:hypothetical protein
MGLVVKIPNTFDSRNRDAREIVADLVALGKSPCRLTIAGSHRLDPSATAAALREQWASIVELVGFEPLRVVTGCAPGGAEKAARLAAKSVTGKLAAVFHRPDMVHSTSAATMFMNIMLSRVGDALLVLEIGPKPTCANLRASFAEWPGKRIYAVEVG